MATTGRRAKRNGVWLTVHFCARILFHGQIHMRLVRWGQAVLRPGACLCLAALILCAGCAFARLKRDLQVAEEKAAWIAGEVTIDSTGSYPVFVVVRDIRDPNQDVLRHWPVYRSSAFRFWLPAPGEYHVLAFEDRNEDSKYQANEPASFCRQGPRIVLSPGQRLKDLTISLTEDSRIDLDSAMDLSSAAEAITLDNITIIRGELASIDDPRFTQTKAEIGLWQPLRFLQEIGTGIYFLESFDAKKTPILFVHGLSGHPGQWVHMIEHLDRDRLQPWLFYYPSGAGLDLISDALYHTVETLRLRYQFTEMHVVGHSMGGLVARCFLNHLTRQTTPLQIPIFLTISTPWGGHEAVEMGIKYAPVVVPSWLGMLPDSAFQNALWETPLPPETAYCLVFSFRGSDRPFMDRNNDGTVTLASQLDHRAQMAASRVYGLFEDHVSVLSNDKVVDLLTYTQEQGDRRETAAP